MFHLEEGVSHWLDLFSCSISQSSDGDFTSAGSRHPRSSQQILTGGKDAVVKRASQEVYPCQRLRWTLAQLPLELVCHLHSCGLLHRGAPFERNFSLSGGVPKYHCKYIDYTHPEFCQICKLGVQYQVVVKIRQIFC